MKKYLHALCCAIPVVFLFSNLNVSGQNTSPYWSLAGNNNATATSKLGTTNAINLSVYTKNLERMRILSANGYVGIGTTAPAARLHVFSTDKQTARFNSNNSTMFLGLYKNNIQRGYVGSTVNFGYDVDFGTSENNAIGKVHFTIKTKPKLTIDTAGHVGINTLIPTNALHVKQKVANRAIQIQHETFADYWTTGIGTNTRNFRFEYNGFLRGQIESSTGTFTQGSDRRLKTEIEPIGKSLDKLVKLTPSSYYYKDSRSWAKNRSVGFIAQELQEQFPELVVTSDEGYLMVNYSGITVMAVKAIQEQQLLIHELDQKTKRLEAIEKELEDLRQIVMTLRNNNSTSFSEGSLEQNAPNPFRGNSIIRYNIPASAKSAHLNITGPDGKLVRSFTLTKFGKGQLSIDGSTLSAGTFSYSLYVNGKLADSKRLVLTK